MIQITANDFEINVKKYLTLATKERIHITENGNDIAILAAPPKSNVNSFIGVIPDDGYSVKVARQERRGNLADND
ncbi:MAG: type II toxin-antitoxin system prevent-host-death family antitoxin [Firmicutes bacterium]|nr:type II toxin-antitoxin system prevent-host-death family antitoxin [Bacillota bacterium]